ncbi:MAG TPA: FKBP-type peptidyl-prolyl cis-trans isomerase [Kofleriaceae bacterium]
MRGSSLLFIAVCATACGSKTDSPPPAGSQAGSGSDATHKPRGEQVPPPVSLQAPPADATRTASGLIYKKLTVNAAGAQPKRNDTVLINYTGWRQGSGETFFTNRGRGKPMPLNLSTTAPGFTEGLQLLRQGETGILWMPPEIGYKTPPATGKAETLVYEVEVVEIQAAPAIPDDVAKAPDKAEALPTAGKRITIKPGTGKDKIRPYDTVTYAYTAWDTSGQMLDTSEMRKRTLSGQPSKQAPAMAEMLTSMVNGERARFWIDAAKMVAAGQKPLAVKTGTVCYEVEVTEWTKAAHEPPPVPADVARPPADAKKTAKGVFYKVVRASLAKDVRHPEAKDTVRVNYTGWTTDGKMFDSSELRGEPATFNLGGVIPGWTDGIPTMIVGDRTRFWIPEDMAYKGQGGKPAGMLVFDVELLGIIPPPQGPPHDQDTPH